MFSPRTGLFILILAHCGLVVAAETHPANAKLISRAVGEVGDHVVTSREVLMDEAVARALAPPPEAPPKLTKASEKTAEKSPAKTSEEDANVLSGDARATSAQVYRTLDEWSIYLEAKALNEKGISRIDQAEAMRKVETRWAGRPSWTSLEISNEELRESVERWLTTSDFEKLKADPQIAPITDDDALAYYRKNRLRFGNLPFSEVKENIKTFLAKSQAEHRLNDWRDILRRKYRVRNFIAG